MLDQVVEELIDDEHNFLGIEPFNKVNNTPEINDVNNIFTVKRSSKEMTSK